MPYHQNKQCYLIHNFADKNRVFLKAKMRINKISKIKYFANEILGRPRFVDMNCTGHRLRRQLLEKNTSGRIELMTVFKLMNTVIIHCKPKVKHYNGFFVEKFKIRMQKR